MFETLYDWFWSKLEYLLPFIRLKRKANLIFLGLDGAGKTTLMGRLKFDRVVQADPTGQPTREEMTLGSTTFMAYDLGGHKQARRVWQDYYPLADAIVFILDADDRERFTEARYELDGLLSIEELRDTPIAILNNKIDIPGAASETEIIYKFGLQNVVSGKDGRTGDNLQGRRPVEVFSCSILKRQGYGRAFSWLSNYV